MYRAALSAFIIVCLQFPLGGLAGPSGGGLLAYLDQRIDKQPDNARLYLRRAHTYLTIEAWREAHRDLDTAEKLGEVLPALIMRGELYTRTGKRQEALSTYKRALEISPDNKGARLKRAKTLAALGEDAAALKDYLRLFRSHPNVGSGHYRSAARLMIKVPDYDTDDALELLDKRMAATGPIPQLQNLAIKIERDRKNYSSAIARMYDLSPLIRQSPVWHVTLAELLSLNDRPADALRRLATAEELLSARHGTPAGRELQNRVNQLRQSLR